MSVLTSKEELEKGIKENDLTTNFDAMLIIKSGDMTRESFSASRPFDVPSNWVYIAPEPGNVLHNWRHPHYDRIVLDRLKKGGFI